MCRIDTARAAARWRLTLARLVLCAWVVWGAALGVASAQMLSPDWRRIGGTAAELMLASPATGPVEAVWFSANGSRLYARTLSGAIFETLDFENWTPAPGAPVPPEPLPATAERLPESEARLAAFAGDPGRVYALGMHLYRSEDGGRSWSNLTAWRSESIIGGPQLAVAVSPRGASQLVVANPFGVWRSLDGGMSWSGLNRYLPNLEVERILATPRGTSGARIDAGPLGTLELPLGSQVWFPVADNGPRRDRLARALYSAALEAEVTAVESAGETVYAGSSDGRMWVSFDAGRTWRGPAPAGESAVRRIWVDAGQPRVALAVLEGPGPRVLRTTNSGTFWDDLTGNLPAGAVHGVAADRASGAVYVAAERGVFYAAADLDNPAFPDVSWEPIGGRLPASPATDVRLDAGANQLYVALAGYGVYAAMAPHRTAALRVVNAADYSARPAAPGGLLSVLGARVNAARAGDLRFPVLAAGESESQIQVPFETSGPDVALALETGNGAAVRVPLPVRAVSPAIFISPDGTPMLLDADTGLLIEGLNAARSGARIQVLATGLGRVRPEWPTGLAAPLENPPEVAAQITAYIDRVPVRVTRAVLAPGYVGFYLVELQLPAIVNAGPAELYLAAGGQESNRVRILLEP